jgi:ribokinase
MPAVAPPFAIVGGLREDYFITPTGQVHLREIGGNAVYAAVGARLWAAPVGLVARVGSNYPAEWLPVFERHGLDTAGVVRDARWLDTRTFYAYLSPDERVDTEPARHFARAGHPLPVALLDYATSTAGQGQRTGFSPLAVRPEEVAPAYWQALGVHLAPYDLLVHQRLPAHLRARGVRCLTCDPSERYMLPAFAAELAELLPQLDAFLPSLMETEAYLGRRLADPWEALETFAAMGARTVVLKLGARGQLVFDAAGRRRWHVPPYPTQVVDVTGAGDAYCGGFLVGLAKTGDALEAALRGTVSASLVVEGTGALFALQAPPGEPQKRLEKLRPAVKCI